MFFLTGPIPNSLPDLSCVSIGENVLKRVSPGGVPPRPTPSGFCEKIFTGLIARLAN